MTEPTSGRHCPACGAEASGRFCASCGGSMEPGDCAICRTTLVPGASFCHRCGAPVGARQPVAAGAGTTSGEPRGLAATLPWVVAGIALLALIGLVAARSIGDARSSGLVAQGAGAFGAAPGVRPPDISQLPPRELANRLYERVMRLHAEGKADSVGFFAANMAIPAFQMLDSLDADARYDLGRIAEVSGALALARAQADTILGASPTHLLGLILAARVAGASGDERARRGYERRLLDAEQAELSRNLPEYQMHAPDIQTAVAEARRRG